MNFYDFFTKQLTSLGMFPNQAKDVMTITMERHSEMKGRWDEDITSYPQQLQNIIWLSIEDIALEYIEKNVPEAWFKPIFDRNSPIRKQFEQ